MVGWPWWAHPAKYTQACACRICVPSSFRGVTTFSLPLNCFAPSSVLIAQSLPASPNSIAQQATPKLRAHRSIHQVIGEMDVKGSGGRPPAVQLQSTTKRRAASSPWVRM